MDPGKWGEILYTVSTVQSAKTNMYLLGGVFLFFLLLFFALVFFSLASFASLDLRVKYVYNHISYTDLV